MCLIGAVESHPEFQLTGTDRVWIYVVAKPEAATVAYPVCQSYVDVVLDGCLEYGDDFAKLFITSTADWAKPDSVDQKTKCSSWLNDREVKKKRIDCILRELF